MHRQFLEMFSEWHIARLLMYLGKENGCVHNINISSNNTINYL